MKEFIKNILGSLTNNEKGFSARKLSALVAIILVIILHVKWFRSDKWEYIAEVLFLDYTFILVCLGLATWQNIRTKQIEKSNGPDTPTV